jgi:polygalacturonase
MKSPSRFVLLLPRMMILLGLLMWAASQLSTNADTPVDFFNVRQFGATGDGKTLDSPAINQAIAAATAAGGGTVLVPAGTYLCGSIELKSNIHLLIDSGATLLGAPQERNAYDETEAWPPNNPYQDGGHCYFHNSLIWGENLENVSITGNGMINGGGLVRDDAILDKMNGFADGGRQASPDLSTYPPVRLGNKAIALKLCRHVLIRDLTIYHGGHFAILVTGCDNMTIDNVTLDTNRDGLDIDCCHNTMVSNCRINSPYDDGLCPKSTFALGRNVLTENLTIVNCQVSGFVEGTLLDGTMKRDPTARKNGRIKFGTESSGGFRNCTVSNCTFRSCFGLALEEVDGGVMEDITINNLSMVDMSDYAIYITTGSRNRGGDLQHPSLCRNITISNVIADGVGKASGIQIAGIPEQPIENIRLENIRLVCNGGGTAQDADKPAQELGTGSPEAKPVPAYGIYCRHVRGLELANITTSFLKDDYRPAASFIDIDGLEMDNFKPQIQPGVSAAVFAPDVQGLVLRNSPLIH